MVGVVEGGAIDGGLVVEGTGGEDDGRKETDKVPENRTTETASAMGTMAVRGLG